MARQALAARKPKTPQEAWEAHMKAMGMSVDGGGGGGREDGDSTIPMPSPHHREPAELKQSSPPSQPAAAATGKPQLPHKLVRKV